MLTHRLRHASLACAMLVAVAAPAAAQTITSPKQHFGFNMGDDYHLATYDAEDTFDQTLAKGFVELWGLPVRVWAAREQRLGGLDA